MIRFSMEDNTAIAVNAIKTRNSFDENRVLSGLANA